MRKGGAWDNVRNMLNTQGKFELKLKRTLSAVCSSILARLLKAVIFRMASVLPCACMSWPSLISQLTFSCMLRSVSSTLVIFRWLVS